MSVRSPETIHEAEYGDLRGALEATFAAQSPSGDTTPALAQTRGGIVRGRHLQLDGCRLWLQRSNGPEPTYHAAVTDWDGGLVASYVYAPDAPRAEDTQTELGSGHFAAMLAIIDATHFDR